MSPTIYVRGHVNINVKDHVMTAKIGRMIRLDFEHHHRGRTDEEM